VGISAAFLLSGFLLTVTLYATVAIPLWGSREPDLPQATALQAAAGLVSFALVTWLIGMRGARLDGRALRWSPGGTAGFARGLAIGAAPAVATMLLAIPLARARWMGDGGSALAWMQDAGGLFGLLAPAALLEEMMFRGVPLVVLASAFSRGTAIVGLGALFGGFHLLNPGITPLAVGNIALAGVFLGVAFYLPGGLWTATGAHLGWNLTLAALAAPVSGLPLPVDGVDYSPGTPVWLTGGEFGPEGGLLATLALGLATLMVALRVRKAEEEAG